MRLYVRLPSHMFRAHRFVCFHTAVPEYLCCVFLKQRTCVTAAAMVLFYVMSKGQIHAHMYVISVQDRYSTQNATSVIYFDDHYDFILEHCQMLELSSLYKTKTKYSLCIIHGRDSTLLHQNMIFSIRQESLWPSVQQSEW